MTYADDEFIAVEGQDEGPSYPTAFGITFTPRVGGIIFGVLGVLGAAYLLANAVNPAWTQYQQLEADVENRQGQIQNKQKIQQEIAQAQERLEQAKQKNQQVLSLFPNQKTLDTLLLDLNNPIKSRNGALTNFAPVLEAQAASNDSAGVVPGNGKLQRKTYNITLEGSFDQVRSILRSFERLQSLLVVRDFKSELSDEQGFLINANGQATPAIFKRDSRQVVPGGNPTLRTTFKLDALVPVSEVEASQAAAQPTQKTKK